MDTSAAAAAAISFRNEVSGQPDIFGNSRVVGVSTPRQRFSPRGDKFWGYCTDSSEVTAMQLMTARQSRLC
jgi:hypothetical protein